MTVLIKTILIKNKHKIKQIKNIRFNIPLVFMDNKLVNNCIKQRIINFNYINPNKIYKQNINQF